MNDSYGQLIEPAPVAFSFGAPGWYVLGAILMFALLAVAWIIFQQYRKNLYRRQALKLITNAEATHPNSASTLLYETNMLLKQIAMSRYGRWNIAGINGMEWINFLNRSCHKALFDENDDHLLQEQLYGSKEAVNTNKLVNNFLNKSKEWIRNHPRIKDPIGNLVNH